VPNDVRLDAWLVEHGFVGGRDKACERIRAGEVAVNGKTIVKPAYRVSEQDEITCGEADCHVGRGGLKLEHALSLTEPLDVGCVALDIGASTGGFTECLLRAGASHVFAVDVGHGQLHPSLQADARVTDLSGTDARRQEELLKAVELSSVDVLTMDVSFISLRAVLPSVLAFLKPQARLFLLIKPQFEAGRSDIGKRGIVSDRRVHYRVLRELCDFFAEQGCVLEALAASPITGGAGRQKGNIEYVALLRREGVAAAVDIRSLVDESFERLQ
jgi:23S rRNA (cytidine1920-2'-O)/16S rRNA (cytidine1409-2'-O)-methyltransferase